MKEGLVQVSQVVSKVNKVSGLRTIYRSFKERGLKDQYSGIESLVEGVIL